MTQIRTVQVATDFSDYGCYAVQRAALLAARLGARLGVLHVVDAETLVALRRNFGIAAEAVDKLVADLRRALDEQAAQCASKAAQPQAAVVVGEVIAEVLAAAGRADLLVVGARGVNRLRDMLVGTTAERVLDRSSRPVLLVKRPPQHPYRRVMVPLEVSSHPLAVLEAALHVAPDATLTIVHAFDVPYRDRLWLAGVAQEQIDEHRARERQQAQERIAALVREAGAEPERVSGIVEEDDPAPLILSKQAALDADLIVMGRRDRSRAAELLLGSVTRRVVSAAPCDVLVVPD